MRGGGDPRRTSLAVIAIGSWLGVGGARDEDLAGGRRAAWRAVQSPRSCGPADPEDASPTPDFAREEHGPSTASARERLPGSEWR